QIVFFQAEDGIRDFHVTGVQTCALPISRLGVPGDLDQGPLGAAGGAAEATCGADVEGSEGLPLPWVGRRPQPARGHAGTDHGRQAREDRAALPWRGRATEAARPPRLPRLSFRSVR